MRNILFVILATLLANSSVFASYDLLCNEVSGSKAKLTIEKDLLHFFSKESSIHQQGMKDLLEAAGASSEVANEYNNIQLSFESDNFQCLDLKPTNVNLQCKVKEVTLRIKARKYKYSASGTFDNFNIKLNSLIISAKKTTLDGYTLISISIKASLPSSDNTIHLPFKYHLFKLNGGYTGSNANCFLHGTFQIL